MTGDKISMREKEGTKIWHIIPGAGKQGKPVVVIKRQTGKNIILIQIQRLFMLITFLSMKMEIQ